ncbi:MAG TPA: hypothetical protein VFS00_00595, partial [Polyangiaceae bacterium]|nr:hypothetical protein [Polyangiaceae bacterium]
MSFRAALALSALLACSCRGPSVPGPSPRTSSAVPASAVPSPSASASALAPASQDAGEEPASDGASSADPDPREAPPPGREAPCTPLPEANAPKLTTLRAPPLPGFPKASTITYPSARTGHPRVDAQLRKALEGLWRKRQRDYAAFLREEGGNAKKRGFELTQDITCGATLATRYALSVDCVGLEEGGGAHPTKVDLTLNLELCAEGVRPLSLARLFRAHSGYRKALVGAWADA